MQVFRIIQLDRELFNNESRF